MLRFVAPIYLICLSYFTHISARKSFNAAACDKWYKRDKIKFGSDQQALEWSNAKLESCPSKWKSKLPKRWYADGGCSRGKCPFHPGAYNCMRTWKGQQCCYKKNGKRCDMPLCGGTADRYPMASRWQYIPNALGHLMHDVNPFDYCCNVKEIWKGISISSSKDKICRSCEKYFKRRPIYGKSKTWRICGRENVITENNYNFIDTITFDIYNRELQQIKTIEIIQSFIVYAQIAVMIGIGICICSVAGFGSGYVVASMSLRGDKNN